MLAWILSDRNQDIDICDECIRDYFMYACVSIICRLSVIFECLGVVVFYLRTCNLLINVLLNRPNI